jgi:hypothetical protein
VTQDPASGHSDAKAVVKTRSQLPRGPAHPQRLPVEVDERL